MEYVSSSPCRSVPSLGGAPGVLTGALRQAARLTLARDTQAPHQGAASSSGLREKPPRQAILVADDDPLIVATFSQGLRSAGFEVIGAFDTTSALKACIEHSPALAILDYRMPGSNGIDLAAAIGAQTSVPVIFLSAYRDEPIVREAIRAGAMIYLVKPIDVEQLLPVVSSAIERARELTALRAEIGSTQKRTRLVSIATGLLMERLQISQKEAFERMRRHARSTRTRLEDVAEALIGATEAATRLYGEIRGRAQGSEPDSPGQE